MGGRWAQSEAICAGSEDVFCMDRRHTISKEDEWMSSKQSIYLMGAPRVTPPGEPRYKIQHRLFQVVAYCIKHQLEGREGLTPKLLLEEVYSDEKTYKDGSLVVTSSNTISGYISDWNRTLSSPNAGLAGLMERLSSVSVDIVEFVSAAEAVNNAGASEATAREFMRNAAPLMNGVFLPVEWKHPWVRDWRDEVDALYAKALDKAYGLLKSDPLEERLEMFDKARRYRAIESGGASRPLPKAMEIWEKLTEEKRAQPLRLRPAPLVIEAAKTPLSFAASVTMQEAASRNSALPVLANASEKEVGLLGATALLHGSAWVEVEAAAQRLLNIEPKTGAWGDDALDGLGLRKEYHGALERVFFKNPKDAGVCMEEFWRRFQYERERIWRWIADYGGSHDVEVKERFALSLKEHIGRCRDGVEQGVLRLWLEHPRFPFAPQLDRRNALLALENAYQDGARRSDVLHIVKTWSESRQIPLLQAAALLCGRCLAKSHPNEGREILRTILEKEGRLAGYVGEGMRGYLRQDAEATFNVLTGLRSWQDQMVGVSSRRLEILRIFLMLMNDSPATKEPSLLLKHASESERALNLCKQFFSKAILDNNCRDEAWCEFSWWLEYSESDRAYMDVVKQIYCYEKESEERLKVYLDLYRNHYRESYDAIVGRG